MKAKLELKLNNLETPVNPEKVSRLGPTISGETIIFTKKYISQLITSLKNDYGFDIGDPLRIMRDCDGGIDVHWKTPPYEGLMNVNGSDAEYFIDKNNRMLCKGKLN